MIRPYGTADLEELLVVWERASLLAHPFLPRDFMAAERDRIAKIYQPAAETWVWESGHCVVGFISLLGDEIGGLFVLPDFARRGIGRSLVDHARMDAKEIRVLQSTSPRNVRLAGQEDVGAWILARVTMSVRIHWSPLSSASCLV